MTRYYFFALLFTTLAIQASEPSVIDTRWQGQWGDGIRDALTLSPLDHQ